MENFWKVTINFQKEWYNRLLTYQNLKKGERNELVNNGDIWIPYVRVQNIETQDKCKVTDIKQIFEVVTNVDYNHTLSDVTNHLNTFLFKGEENLLNFESVWTCEFVCQFDYKWYPFDTQNCQIQLNVSELEIELLSDTIEYTGQCRT